MIENAKGQIILVLTLVAASVASLITREVNLGLDLAGGTELIYLVNKEKAMKDLDEETSWDTFMQTTVGIIRDRIDPQGTLDAQVLRRGVDGIYIALPDVSAQQAKEIEAKITRLGTLRMQVCAYDEHPKTKEKKFDDLAEEKRRLEAWIKEGENRTALLENPEFIERFHQLNAKDGGRESENLKWIPHKIEKKLHAESTAWDGSFAKFGNTLSPNIVTLYPTEHECAAAGRAGGWAEALPGRVHAGQHARRPRVRPGERHRTPTESCRSGDRPGERPPSACVYEIAAGERKDDYCQHTRATYIGRFESAIILRRRTSNRRRPYIRAGSTDPGPHHRWLHGRQEAADSRQGDQDRARCKVKPEFVSPSVRPSARRSAKRSIFLRSGSRSSGSARLLVLLFILATTTGKAGLVAFTVGIAAQPRLPDLRRRLSSSTPRSRCLGIAGLVLTIGMAVDANILIYERIREEIKQGQGAGCIAVRHRLREAPWSPSWTRTSRRSSPDCRALQRRRRTGARFRGNADGRHHATSLFTAFFISDPPAVPLPAGPQGPGGVSTPPDWFTGWNTELRQARHGRPSPAFSPGDSCSGSV